MNEQGILLILWWINDGSIHYRCWGTGPKYNRFYTEWIPTSSYRCTGEGWPWDLFVFDNPEDHDRLIRDFPGSVSEEIK